MKRNILGAILFLALVGEVNVGAVSGFFTLPGVIVFFILYLLYFLLLDSIVAKYRLNNIGLVLVNFALYSVLITGLLHGEIADYVLQPEHNLGTTLVRIQCSFYPLFAFFLLRKFVPFRQSKISVGRAFVMFIIFFALISPSKQIGFVKLLETFQIAPFLSILFTILALVALLTAIRMKNKFLPYSKGKFELWSWLLLAISLIPGLPFFWLLLTTMIIVSFVFMTRSNFRNSLV